MVDPGSEVGLGQWVLSSADGTGAFTFNIGPSAETLQRPKTLLYQNELGADSTVRSVVFQGKSPIPALLLTGTVLEVTSLGILQDFALSEVPLLVTDDLGRSLQVVVESFKAVRKRNASHPERHDYTMKLLVLDGLLDGSFWAAYV